MPPLMKTRTIVAVCCVVVDRGLCRCRCAGVYERGAGAVLCVFVFVVRFV